MHLHELLQRYNSVKCDGNTSKGGAKRNQKTSHFFRKVGYYAKIRTDKTPNVQTPNYYLYIMTGLLPFIIAESRKGSWLLASFVKPSSFFEKSK